MLKSSREGNSVVLLDSVSIQDRDLLGRLTQYFATIEARLKEGQGWLIFNASRERASRLTAFVLHRLAEQRPFVSYYHVPWRDFALNAYMLWVEIPGHAPEPASIVATTPLEREYTLAGHVSDAQLFQMRFCDLLFIATVRPVHSHEVSHLSDIVSERFRARRATILVLPGTPEQATTTFGALDTTGALWPQLYDQMYRTSLIAL